MFNTNIKFIEEIILNNFGFIDLVSEDQLKPVQLHPISSVQKSYEINKNDFQLVIGDNIVKYLKEVFIYFNSKYSIGNDLNLHKQFLYPVTSGQQNELDPKYIIGFLDKVKLCPIKSINIIGNNLFNYSGYDELISYLSTVQTIKNYYLSLSDLDKSCRKLVDLIAPTNIFTFILFDNYDEKKLKNLLDIIKNNSINAHFRFVVSNEKQVTSFNQLIKDFSIDNYSYTPYFDEKNYQFFYDNVFFNFNEVLELKNDMIDIHTKEYINPLFFGKLSLLPDNSIYTDLNDDMAVGYNDHSFSVKEVLYKTLTTENSWRLTRSKVEECKNCVARYICTPISKYELFFKNYRICKK